MANALKKQIISSIITVLVACTAWATYMQFFANKYNNYIVYYTDVKGLQASSPVLLHGVRIGKIKSITIENAGLVKIVIQVTQDVSIHTGAVAELKSTGLISDKSVSIIDGNSNTILKNGDVIISDTTTSSAKNTISVEAINNKLHNADSALQYIHDSSSALNSVSSGLINFDKKMKSYANTSGNLVNKVNNVASTIGNFSASAKKLNTSSSNLPSTTTQLANKTNKINQSGIQNSVDTLRRSINTLSKAIQRAKNITADSKTYTQTSRNIESLNNDAKDYSNHPKGFSILGKSKKKK